MHVLGAEIGGYYMVSVMDHTKMIIRMAPLCNWNFANNICLTIQFYQVWSTSVCREMNLVYYFCLLHSKVTVLEWSQVGISSKVVTDWSTSRRPQSIAGSVYCLAN